ncbi:Cas10/Cmr2 second palm domain-containing protein [Streptosporangium canum]|uniref:Cas10/Cmr2 second palm domain-containing protein n=1 Tax=Streptosporangium canum TaxID=324952 RepID=UPI0037B46F23
MFIVMIRTAGNQRYIFSSGKRKEIVGASDLVARVNGVWTEEALREIFPGFEKDHWRIASHDAELLVASAGRVTLLVKEADAGRRLVTALTLRALDQAPGLDVCGVVVPYERGSLNAVMKNVQTELAAVREVRPGPQARFLRLPPVEDCASSGLPAAGVRAEGKDEPAQPRSAAALAKLDAYQDALERLAVDADVERRATREIVDDLGLRTEWVAVVHADGNGFGELFLKLGESAQDDEAYAGALRDFSAGVDRCGKGALREALRRTAQELGKDPRNEPLKLLPLVLGGDDLTVVCEGEVALPFTRHYLEAFEEETATDPWLGPLLKESGREYLSAGAGVAIVKRNYPFHFAYQLAEKLAEAEAKKVKDWSSALAFVVLFESAAPDLERIRASVTLSGGSGGTASPYVVGEGSADLRGKGRRWADLERRAHALNRREPGSKELLIPRSAAHDLREGVCLGAEVAASRLDLLRQRFEGDRERSGALMELTEKGGGLLWTDHGGKSVTGLLDAMATLQFLKPKERAE